jgi:hypothetical protein
MAQLRAMPAMEMGTPVDCMRYPWMLARKPLSARHRAVPPICSIWPVRSRPIVSMMISAISVSRCAVYAFNVAGTFRLAAAARSTTARSAADAYVESTGCAAATCAANSRAATTG